MPLKYKNVALFTWPSCQMNSDVLFKPRWRIKHREKHYPNTVYHLRHVCPLQHLIFWPIEAYQWHRSLLPHAFIQVDRWLLVVEPSRLDLHTQNQDCIWLLAEKLFSKIPCASDSVSLTFPRCTLISDLDIRTLVRKAFFHGFKLPAADASIRWGTRTVCLYGFSVLWLWIKGSLYYLRNFIVRLLLCLIASMYSKVQGSLLHCPTVEVGISPPAHLIVPAAHTAREIATRTPKRSMSFMIMRKSCS